MEKFKKLSRAEMKKAGGGGNGNCQPISCSTTYFIGGRQHFGLGVCSGACICVPLPGEQGTGTCNI